LKAELVLAKHISLTTDMWTSTSNVSFTGLTAHYLNENNILTSKLLDCPRFSGRHTAENIVIEITKILQFYDIAGKIVSVTADHASNEKKVIRDLGLQYIGCFAHDLHLICSATLNNIPRLQALTEKASEIVTLTRKSSSAKERFESYQTSKPPLRLNQAVQHRWNSTYLMLMRIIELKQPISLFMAEERGYETFTADEWDDIEKAVAVLKPLYDATVEFSSEKYPTISKVIPTTNLLQKFYVKAMAENRPETVGHNLAKLILQDLKTRYGAAEEAHCLAIATMLDPRFKNKFRTLVTSLCKILHG